MNTSPQDNTQPTGTNPTNGSTSSGANPAQAKFDIPAAVKEKYPDLIDLIIETKSMDDKERQYWFHILPVMNVQQVEKLKTILLNEKSKLAEIDQKYSQPLGPQVVAMKDNEIRDKMASVQKEETEHKKQEADKEAELLKQLENL